VTVTDHKITGVGRSPIRGLPRVLRIGLLGGVSLGLATMAHLAGGARLPSPGVLTVAGLLLGLVAVTLTARRCRFGLLLPVLAIQQVLLHLVFDAATSAAACGTTNDAGMSHAATVSCSPAATMTLMSVPSSAMWVGHLIATLLTAWLLARGEAWLWRVANRIVRAATTAPGGPRKPASTTAEVTQPPQNLCPPAVHSAAAPRGPPKVVIVN
jgi:hypothetical protein